MPRIFSMFFLLGIFIFNSAHAHERIFYENCEDTNYSTYFLERSQGAANEDKWNELRSELTRSTIAYLGNHSMTYNPWVTGNPNGRVGVGDFPYGNRSGFNLASYRSRYWYFRWYQRWESNTSYSGENKLIYINYKGRGDFKLTLKKANSQGFHVSLTHVDTDQRIINTWPGHNTNLDDEQWHKMEIYIDVGTTGGNNGHFWIKIDGRTLEEKNNITFRETIHSNPIVRLTGWPSNTSAETGSQKTWIDEQEIYILDGPNDIPGSATSSVAKPANLRFEDSSNLN